MQLRVAIIGCGNIADHHVKALLAAAKTFAGAAPAPVVTVLCDPNDKARAAIADEVRTEAGWEPVGFATLEDALATAAATFDAALILVPNHLHESASLACFAAGKHVLLEKPIAITEESGEHIIAEAKRYGRVLMVAENAQFWHEVGSCGPLPLHRPNQLTGAA